MANRIDIGSMYINGEQKQSDSIVFKFGTESCGGDFFVNADSEIFYKTTKIAQIKKVGIFGMVLNKIKELVK